MSQFEPSPEGVVLPKSLGRRILEIMEERGKAFTVQAFANRIGMNRVTLSKKLKGKNDLYMFELRRIAEILSADSQDVAIRNLSAIPSVGDAGKKEPPRNMTMCVSSYSLAALLILHPMKGERSLVPVFAGERNGQVTPKTYDYLT